jgi:membrane protease YdiL (CAAX protease family)
LELAVVFGLTVGLPVLAGRAGSGGYNFGQRRLLSTIVEEVVIVAILWPWLRRRGWAFGSIAGSPVPFDVVRGFGIAVAAYIAYYLAAITWATWVPGGMSQLSQAVPIGSAAPWVVVLVSTVNPIVEEFLWLGYGYTALRPFGNAAAILGSAGLRTLLHAYQGAMALVSILPLGLVFTIYYARSRRIWPVIVAHMLFDVIALLRVIHS